MKRILKWLWYTVLGVAGLAVVLIIAFFILIFISGPPVNKESDERNTSELLENVETVFEEAVEVKLPEGYRTLLVSSHTQPTVDHEVEYNLVVTSSSAKIQNWANLNTPFGKGWVKTIPTEMDEIKKANDWRPIKIKELRCGEQDKKLQKICNFVKRPTPVLYSFNRLRVDYYQILIAAPDQGFIWLQDVKF
ncbi:hypothetical protein OAN83_00470 [Alphaproteobacteria bacterium]|nr:hypothetical protein [Alphaproteobacteria bacterium]